MTRVSHCYGSTLSVGFSETAAATLISLPAAIGEIGTCVGVREPKPQSARDAA